jgi:DNA-binding IclR family transcriptional regulator
MALQIEHGREVGEALLLRIKAEYGEMPGLCLTAAQASRLWALDPLTCETALDALTSARFLRRTPDGRYALTPASLNACAWNAI